jgi:hypothetical protein
MSPSSSSRGGLLLRTETEATKKRRAEAQEAKKAATGI